MSLVNMTDMLKQAEEKNYAVGSFSVLNMEMIIGTIKAAEELKAPIILQIAEGRLGYAPLALMAPMMLSAARAASVPVAVHLDHGLRVPTIQYALDLGFTSVMFDGSKVSLQENIETTKKVIQLARQYGATAEAEIGKVGGSEDGSEDLELMATPVEDAQRFYEETKVDALAVAIGNAHGVYKSAPQLQFDRLAKLDKVVGTALVLHGGSGITVEDFRKCIDLGIRKINVMTAALNRITAETKILTKEKPDFNYYDYTQCAVNAVYQNTKEHILAFRGENKA